MNAITSPMALALVFLKAFEAEALLLERESIGVKADNATYFEAAAKTSRAAHDFRMSLPGEGSVPDAGVDMSFRIGRHVRHRDYKGQRVTGVVRGLSIDGEQGLMVSIALDAPIVIPASDSYAEVSIHTQCAPAHEFAPFDERDELMAEMLAALRKLTLMARSSGGTAGPDSALMAACETAEAVIAKAGSPA